MPISLTVSEPTEAQRVLVDLDARSRPAVHTFWLSWAALALGAGLFRTHPTASGVLLGVFLALTGMRLLVQRRLHTHPNPDGDRAATRLLRVAVLTSCAGWGGLTGAALAGGPVGGALAPSTTSLVLTGAVICPLLTVMLAADPWGRRGVPAAMLAPLAAGLVARPDVTHLVYLVLVALFAAVLVGLAEQVGRDYTTARTATARLEEEHAEQAARSTIDPLTGLANRQQGEERLGELWNQAVRTGEPISLLVVDVDHLQALNDTYGHAFGDECLAATAAALRTAVPRTTDMVARYGGEEFLVLLPASDADSAKVVAERLRLAVAATEPGYEGLAVRLTVSIGATTWRPRPGDPVGATLQRAEEALGEAKRAGRNRICVWSHPEESSPHSGGGLP